MTGRLSDIAAAAPNLIARASLTLDTRGPGIIEFTADAAGFLRRAGAGEGLFTAYVRHTSASLTIQENADPDVQTDLKHFFQRLVPPSDDASMRWMIHTTEGPDDMPAHIKSALTQTSVSIPVIGGTPVFGTWQGIYLFEHRHRPHRREVVLHIIGE